MRINRFLARAGIGSRRGVEDLIRSGRVRVDGEVVTDLGRQVDAENVVEFDGKPVVAASSNRVLLLHKPLGVVCSLVRQDQRPCLLDVIPEGERDGRLFHVGRLDHDSTGLLLLSDDGDLGHGLLHPKRPVMKRYDVQLWRPITQGDLGRLSDGSIVLDGRPLAPAIAESLDGGGRVRHLRLELREGRNRQIRRMIEAVGSRVRELHRTAFGPIELGTLAVGASRRATSEEITALRMAAGLEHASGD